MTPIKVIGVCGRKRHGKDQIVEYLREHGYHRIAYADELKRIAMDIWELTFEQMYGGDEIREVVDPRWGLSPRQIMQNFGTDVGRSVHKATWVRKTFANMQKSANGQWINLPDFDNRCFAQYAGINQWAVSDVRFPSEAQAIKDAGGLVIKVIRPGIVSNDTHASETEVDNVIADHEIMNDSTLADLKFKVDALAASGALK